MKNWTQTVLSQYATSPRLMALLAYINEWISPDKNFEDFYNLVWNVDTAVGYGLDVWGRIVNVKRTLTVTAGMYFGFGEAGDRFQFGLAPFYNGEPTTTNYRVSDDVYRLMILAKAAFNITDGSIPAINAILMNLFPNRGNAYVTDGGMIGFGRPFGFGEALDRMPFGFGPFGDDMDPSTFTNMTMVYNFDFPLEPFEIAIVTEANVLPKPTGVKATLRYPT